MRSQIYKLASAAFALSAAVFAVPAAAENAASSQSRSSASSGQELPPYLQCVPFARERSGVQIFGDAHTWWGQAQGKYQRGNAPRVGAVMAFKPHRNMRLGHVAAVVELVDDRTVLLSHSNWSPINGRRGQIERNVRAVDVSPNNDWSQVRVWYHPIQAVGRTAWPVHGFIYSERSNGQPSLAPTRVARAVAPERPQPARAKSSAEFLNAFSSLEAPSAAPTVTRTPTRQVRAVAAQPRQARVATAQAQPDRQFSAARAQSRNPQRSQQRVADPVSAALARYE